MGWPMRMFGLGPWALAMLSFGASGPISQFEGKSIVDVQFSTPQPLDAADLAKAQPLKKGQPLHAEDVAHAIDGLFATGWFDDIAVEAEPAGDGVLIRFVTKNVLFVGGVSVEGKLMDAPSHGQAWQAASLPMGMAFREADVTHAVESLQRLLQSNGLYEAQVTPTITPSENAQIVSVTFQVAKGKRAKYEMPAVQGETNLSDATLVRITGWRIPIIHWWRQVTDSRTHKGVHNLLVRYQNQDRLKARVEVKKLDYDSQ